MAQITYCGILIVLVLSALVPPFILARRARRQRQAYKNKVLPFVKNRPRIKGRANGESGTDGE